MSVADEMVRLLEEEARILTGGRFNSLAGLVARKEALEARCGDLSGADPGLVRRIAALAERNAGLIEAAQRGIRAARDEMRAVREGLAQATYDEAGARRPLGPRATRLERKA